MGTIAVILVSSVVKNVPSPLLNASIIPMPTATTAPVTTAFFCDFTAALPMHKSTLHRRLHLLPDSKPLGVHVFLRLWTS